MKILLAVLFFAVVAQIPSCEQEESGPIVGFVTDKYLAPGGTASHPAILIQATEYLVPWDFYREVHIGDLVKYEKGRWTILKKATTRHRIIDLRLAGIPPGQTG